MKQNQYKLFFISLFIVSVQCFASDVKNVQNETMDTLDSYLNKYYTENMELLFIRPYAEESTSQSFSIVLLQKNRILLDKSNIEKTGQRWNIYQLPYVPSNDVVRMIFDDARIFHTEDLINLLENWKKVPIFEGIMEVRESSEASFRAIQNYFKITDIEFPSTRKRIYIKKNKQRLYLSYDMSSEIICNMVYDISNLEIAPQKIGTSYIYRMVHKRENNGF